MELVGEPILCGGCGREAVEDDVVDLRHRCRVEARLALEVVVENRRGHAGDTYKLGDAGAVISAFGEEHARGTHEPGSCLLGVRSRRAAPFRLGWERSGATHRC